MNSNELFFFSVSAVTFNERPECSLSYLKSLIISDDPASLFNVTKNLGKVFKILDFFLFLFSIILPQKLIIKLLVGFILMKLLLILFH